MKMFEKFLDRALPCTGILSLFFAFAGISAADTGYVSDRPGASRAGVASFLFSAVLLYLFAYLVPVRAFLSFYTIRGKGKENV